MRNFSKISIHKRLLTLLTLLPLLQCTDEHLLSPSTITVVDNLNSSDAGSTELDACGTCTYVIPESTTIVDGNLLELVPGNVICLDSRIKYGNLIFRNLRGSRENPIIIRNCGGIAQVDGTGKSNAIKTENSQHFRITGGDVKNSYGIIVSGGTMGINIAHFSSHFEVDHVEIQHVGFAGLMAKTDPGCDEATWRGNFLMKGVAIHNNYIHDTGGEGIYAGNSFFKGAKTSCGEKLPHEIHYIRIYSNVIRNTGWEGIQLGCATRGASIHANIIENYGLAGIQAQNNGIQIGAGTGGLCYNNLIKRGSGNGLIVMGLGDNVIYNNIIDQAGNYGIFCDERYSPGPGFKFINNTILNPKSDGIRIYADEVAMNVIVNNIIANPGSYSLYSYPRASLDAFIYKLSDRVKIEEHHNYFTTDCASIAPLAKMDTYRLEYGSPVIDQGADISAYNIKTDFYYKSRLRGTSYDIGAVEQY